MESKEFQNWIELNTYHEYNDGNNQLFMYKGESYFKAELFGIYNSLEDKQSKPLSPKYYALNSIKQV